MNAMDSDLTTASFMLLCRVGEQMARTHYEKFTKNNAEDKNWNTLYKEIKDKQPQDGNVNYTILDLFGFLKQKT